MSTRTCVALLLFALSAPFASQAATAECTQPHLYFDLGGVVIDSKDMQHVKPMPGVREYLMEARQRGFHLSLIVNIPETWGDTYAQKLAKLHEFVDGNWAGMEGSFEWDFFESVLLPTSDALRKPDPFLFREAIREAAPCPAIYQGEDSAEVEAARKAGMKAWRVGESGRPFLIPFEQLGRARFSE